MADIAPTLDLIDSAIGAGGRGAPSPPISAMDEASAKAKPSAASQTIDLLQAGIDKKLPEVTKPYETTAESLVLNTESGANSALASTLGGPVDLVNYGLRKVGLPVSENPLGGSESIKRAMGLINANPDNVVPQNKAEQIAHGVGEGAGSAVLLPLGGELLAAGKVISPAVAQTARAALGAPDALNATIGAVGGAGSTIAADAVPEQWKPIAATVGGLVAGAPVVALHGAASSAKAAIGALRDRVTEEGAKRLVGKEMAAAATDQSAARENLAEQPHEIVPGSTGTTGQIAGDTGLLGWEGSVRQQNPEAFNARAADQNAARTEHLESVQPTGNAADLPEAVKTQRDAADQHTQAIVDQLHADHAAELAKVKEFQPNGSPADVAQHFRDQRDALDRATQATVDRAETEAQAARDQVPSGRPEDVGANLRAPAQEARNAAKERENSLWKAVDPDGTLSVSMGPIQGARKAIYGDMTKAGEAGLSPAERSLTGVIEQYKPVESFKELTDLRSMVSTAMREELKTSGRTPAFGRMSQLRSSVENAIDSSVENRAVQEHGAIARGALSSDETMANALHREISNWYAGRQAQTGENVAASTRGISSNGPPVVAEPSRSGVSSGRQSGSSPGDQGLPADVAPNFDAAARERLTAANEATRTRAQTFDEGPAGKLLKPCARAGEYKATDAQAPSIVFHPGPTGGEDVRAYLHAAGEGAVPALSDAAAVSARAAAARADGTLDPAKLTSWAQKHAPALAELPEGVRSRFENAATAEHAISDAMAARRDAIENFNKTSAAKVAGLSEDGDIVRHVGSILDKKDGAKQLGELATAAKSNPAATEGLKRAVVEDVFNRFLPESKPDLGKLKSFVDERKDVLAKVFPEKDLSALSDQIAKAREAGANAQKSVEDRKATLDQYDKTILGKVMGLTAKRDVVDTIGGIFGKSDAAQQMETLAKTAAKTPGGSEALKKAVTEYLQQKFTGTAEAGTTGTLEMNRATFQRFMREHTDTLGKVLDDKQIGKLSAIVQDQLRANRSITATKLAGGSDTTQKLIANGKLNSGTILSHLAMEAIGNVAGAIAGFAAGGPVGAFLGKEGGSLGAKTMAALRDAGINRINEIRVKAALDPEFGKALLSEMPKKPDRDAAALIALRARQWLVSGASAGARQTAQ